jgi:hypothetical protein
MPANHVISFTVTAKQFHILKELARKEYRSLNNLTTTLLAIGYQIYSEDHSIYVQKRPKDRDPDKSDWQLYEDEEVMTEIQRIPFNSLPAYLQQ